MKANKTDLDLWIDFEIMELAGFIVEEKGAEALEYAKNKLTEIQESIKGLSHKEANDLISEQYERLKRL